MTHPTLEAMVEAADLVLLPRVATADMMRAARKRVAIVTPDGTWALALDQANRVYDAMRDAAPTPTVALAEYVRGLEEKAEAVIRADDEFRRHLPEGTERDPVTVACDQLRAALSGGKP